MSPEEELHQAMLDMYRSTGAETGYWANYFNRDIKVKGGLKVAKKLLATGSGGTIGKGLQTLIDHGRADLSLEALVLTPKYSGLFTEEELGEARARLDALPSNAFPEEDGSNAAPGGQGDATADAGGAIRKNPPWHRDELILALDLYFRHPPRTVSQTHPEVIALSDLLNALPIHADRTNSERFRNPNGVYMKLGNFLSLDPEYHGAGLSRVGKLDAAVWDEFASDRAKLHQLALAIAEGYSRVGTDIQLDDEDETDFPEGRVLYRLHRQRERNAKLVNKKKAAAEALACEVCSFDFSAAYGEIGRGYIECHHTVPISDYQAGQKTKLQDLALVCANCHRMLHRRRPWLTISALSRLMFSQPVHDAFQAEL